jgi:hypothetical protein
MENNFSTFPEFYELVQEFCEDPQDIMEEIERYISNPKEVFKEYRIMKLECEIETVNEMKKDFEEQLEKEKKEEIVI